MAFPSSSAPAWLGCMLSGLILIGYVAMSCSELPAAPPGRANRRDPADSRSQQTGPEASAEGEETEASEADEARENPAQSSEAEALEAALAELTEAPEIGDYQMFPPESGRLSRLNDLQRVQYIQAFRGLLLDGLPSGKRGATANLDSARQHVRSARALCRDDPRLPYAFGLVLLAQGETDEALQEFSTACELAQAPHLGALANLAGIHLQRSEHDAAVEVLVRLADGLSGETDAWPTQTVRAGLADVVGRAVGFLTGRKAAVAADGRDRILAKLPADLVPAFRHGLNSVRKRQTELENLANLPEDQLRKDAQTRVTLAKSETDQANEALRHVEQRLRDLKKPHAEDLRQVAAEVRQKSQQLRKLSVEARQLAEEADNLSRPRRHANTGRNQGRVSVGRSGRVRVSPNAAWRKETSAEKKSREKKLQEVQSKLATRKIDLRNLQADMALARARRQQIEKEFADSAGELKQEVNAARARRIEADQAWDDAREAADHPERLLERAHAFATYLPLDPDRQKQQLLESLQNDE